MRVMTWRALSMSPWVMAGAPIVLLHSQTNQLLSVEGQSVMNDFGKELELCGHTSVAAGTSYKMEAGAGHSSTPHLKLSRF